MLDYSKVKCTYKNEGIGGMYRSWRFECDLTDEESRDVLRENGVLEEYEKENGKEIKKLVITVHETPSCMLIEDVEVCDIDNNWNLQRLPKHNFDIDKLLKLI